MKTPTARYSRKAMADQLQKSCAFRGESRRTWLSAAQPRAPRASGNTDR
jgi:hypothetical protein